MVYSWDELVDKFFVLDPEKRLTSYQISDAFKNMADYIKSRVKEEPIVRRRYFFLDQKRFLKGA